MPTHENDTSLPLTDRYIVCMLCAMCMTYDFDMWFVDAPWCGHCKSLAPEYAKAATKLAEEDSPIKLAKVDATQEQELAENFGVRGYPTLKFFKNGSPVDYSGNYVLHLLVITQEMFIKHIHGALQSGHKVNEKVWLICLIVGGRQADDIVNWLKKKTGPPAIEVSSADQAKELIAANPVIVFGYFADQDTDKAKAFLTVAGLVDDQVFAIVSDDKLIDELEAEDQDVILHKKVINNPVVSHTQ